MSGESQELVEKRQNNRSLALDLGPGSPQYKIEMLPPRT
jgi:hypothetical protein